VRRSYETQELREFAETIQGRRTIELFLQTPVPDQLIDDAIEAATWAPNHHVTEPWHFYTLGRATKERCLDLCRDIVSQKVNEKAGDFKRSAKKLTRRREISNAKAGQRNRAGWS